ncbi:MAG TPA: heme-binding domain-containing protein [Bacteroidales bacterium]|nr:heme-binding domain-containing protein [Bacteroidales bacterium]
MNKTVKIILGIVIAALIIMQFFQPDFNVQKSASADNLFHQRNVPNDVQTVLKKACFDCHSNQTERPWYSYVAPVSYFLASDVHEARDHMNFSEWGTYSTVEAHDKANHICKMVKEGKMPLKAYTLMHKEARLSDRQVKLLCNWVDSLSFK